MKYSSTGGKMKYSSTGGSQINLFKILINKVKDGNKIWNFDIEPAVLIHMMTSLIIYVTIQNLLIEKSCLVNLGFSKEVCDVLISKDGDTKKYVEEEKEIQKFVGTVIVWRIIFENLFPMFLVLLIGVWSDKYGRKLPILFVIFGFFVQNIALVFCVYFKYAAGAWCVAFVSSVIPGLTGNQASFAMAVYSYVSDNTIMEHRTIRTGLTHTIFFFGLTLGLATGGILSKFNIAFIRIFTIGAIMEALVFLYVLKVIMNVRDERAFKENITVVMIKDLFNTTHAKDAISSVFNKKLGSTRTKLVVLLITHICIMASIVGDIGVLQLFGRYKFNWDGGEIAYFMTYRRVIGFLGNFVSMLLLGKVLKMGDPSIGITCCTSGLLANILFAYANNNSLMFIGPVISILSGAAIIVPRSIASKIIPGNEMGKVGSLFACLDSLIPLLSAPLYNFLYTKTFETFPGAFFLLSALLMIPPIFTFIWVRSSEQKEMKQE